MGNGSPGGCLVGLLITVVVGAVGWFVFGRAIVDEIGASNERSGGGGPAEERIVNARRLGGIVTELRAEAGAGARAYSFTLRPLSAELVVAKGGGAVGYRWRERRGPDGVEPFPPSPPTTRPWPLSRLDPTAPERIARAISEAEGGDFHLSIADLEPAGTGRLVWVMRGRIGERGVAYVANPAGGAVRRYDPSSPELSQGAALAQCLRAAAGDPAALQRCVRRHAPGAAP